MGEVDPGVVAPRGAAAFLDELQQQLALLEALFDDSALTQLRQRAPNHPAVLRYDRLAMLVANSGRFDRAADLELVFDLTSSMIDRFTWAPGRVGSDVMNHLGDARVARFVSSRIPDPSVFDDVISELFVWGWLRSNGMAVRLNQEDGLADLEIEPGTKSIWADVKRIHLGSSPRRMRTVIKKANSQIKRSGGTAGIAFIHIERPRLRASFDDRVPTDIAPFVDEALRELGSSNSKSVGRVVVSWDDYFVHAAPGSPSIYTVRRRSIVL